MIDIYLYQVKQIILNRKIVGYLIQCYGIHKKPAPTGVTCLVESYHQVTGSIVLKFTKLVSSL